MKARGEQQLTCLSRAAASPRCTRTTERERVGGEARIAIESKEGALQLQIQVTVVVFLPTATMQNEEGQMVDLYVPRKCSATNRIITAKDHASVQINIGHVDENGLYDGRFTTFALSGFIRAQGDADSALDRLWQKRKAEIKQQ